MVVGAAAAEIVIVMNKQIDNESKDVKRKSQLLKILIPVLIVIAVIGVYFIKNNGQDTVNYTTSEFDLDATEDFDLEKILSHGLPIMIDFGSDSCIPCKAMEPILEELNEELRGKAIVKFVDVWKNPDAAQNMPLRVIPTQLFFDKDGKPYVPDTDDGSFIMYGSEDTGQHLYTMHEGGMEKDQILEIMKELGVE